RRTSGTLSRKSPGCETSLSSSGCCFRYRDRKSLEQRRARKPSSACRAPHAESNGDLYDLLGASDPSLVSIIENKGFGTTTALSMPTSPQVTCSTSFSGALP